MSSRARALEAGVVVDPLSQFALSPEVPSGLALGYGAIATSRIDEGVRRLASCMDAPR